MGLFGGGGGGGGDGGAAAASINKGTEEGLKALQQYYSDAIPALQQGANNAQGYLAGYGVAGTTALDALYDTLGLARPTVGTGALTAALQNQSYLENKSKGTLTSTTGTTSQTTNPQQVQFNPWNGASNGDRLRTDDGQYIFDPKSGVINTTQATWDPVNHKVIDTKDPSELGYRITPDGSGRYKLEGLSPTTASTTTTTPVTMSADEQKQLDILNQYKSGSLGMQTADSNSILSQLQNTPGYKFMMQQGLQGIDRSAAAQGLLGSGASMKGAQEYGSGLAEQTYNTRVSQLAQQAGLGAQVAGQQSQISAGLGTGLANAALGMGSNVASLYGAQGNNLASISAGQSAADAQSNSSGLGLIGSVAGGLFSMFSDRRLKRNIKAIDVLPNGLPIYEYNYITDDQDCDIRVGVMAQEALLTNPDCVFTDKETGYYKVDYNRLARSI